MDGSLAPQIPAHPLTKIEVESAGIPAAQMKLEALARAMELAALYPPDTSDKECSAGKRSTHRSGIIGEFDVLLEIDGKVMLLPKIYPKSEDVRNDKRFYAEAGRMIETLKLAAKSTRIAAHVEDSLSFQCNSMRDLYQVLNKAISMQLAVKGQALE